MDEVNVVIQSVLPVQQSLPPQKEKGLEIQSKNENHQKKRKKNIIFLNHR